MQSLNPTIDFEAADPFSIFDSWYREAEVCEAIRYAHAMCLSTVDLEGRPDGRMVLLKQYDERGFVFFTDRNSHKGEQLAERPSAALTFYWEPLDRQVRIQGRAEAASEEESDACFQRRPRGSQVTAWASNQSHRLESPQDLQERVEQLTERFADLKILPRPPRWQAYRVDPRRIEFWQARSHRLHDRWIFERQGESWSRHRLEP